MRGVIRRGIVTATALAAVSGAVAPTAAIAAPAGKAARAGGIGTTDQQRVAAAAVVRLDPTPDVLLFSDYDFVHALWQKARDAGERLGAVRTAAEAAMASKVDADHAQFITTGIHKAYDLDKQRERDQAEAERAARLAKSQALLTVGIPSTPELLALSDDNFVRAIARHSAAGPEVKAAAIRALLGDAAAQREFIVNGIREAHKIDVANEIKELEEQNRLEAERRKALAARKSAAALFRISPSEAMLQLSDDNFIRELLRTAPADLAGTELLAAAQRAVLSSNPADWKQFIHTGASEAYKRDDEARLKKVAENNRRLALQIVTAAKKGGVNPWLVTNGEQALSGSDESIANFLKEETQRYLKRQSLWAGNQGMYLRQSDADQGEAFVALVRGDSKESAKEDATWFVVPSLAGEAGCYSFESLRKPGHYLMADRQSFRVRTAADDRSAEFRESASWCARILGDSGPVVFSWAVDRERRLGHEDGEVYATTGGSGSWRIHMPHA
ncbi:AbfB domain-containing protein [Streptomyces sp. NPDC007369]|uniref:AbfB domain-containing protein n=1 Tax=Streptomyces sp. NPDC007369 TaxID=3154589 RepID=UPI0033CFB9F5